MILKIGGVYETKDNTFIYVGVNKCIEFWWDDGYDEEHFDKSELDTSVLKDPNNCLTGIRSKRYNMFYAVWDGANKSTLRYILPVDIITQYALKK